MMRKTEDEIKHKLVSMIAAIMLLSEPDIDTRRSFFEYGLDSLHLQELLARFEMWYGGVIEENVLFEHNTIDALARHLATAPIIPASGARTIPEPAQDGNYYFHDSYLKLKERQSRLGLSDRQTIFFDVHENIAKDTTVINGKNCVNFASYNYLGLSGDREVMQAAVNAIKQYGTSVSASRLVSGQKPLHIQLEREIAGLLGVEDALVFNSGYATNVNTISHLFNQEDLILHDEFAHNSLVQGAVFSRAKRLAFRHNDAEYLENLLKEHRSQYKNALILSEGLFSMDGDYPDLPALIALKEKYSCVLMIDEAHSIGTLGITGRGISQHFNVDPRKVDIWMGTLSKSLASCGGYIAGPSELIEYLKFTCPGFIFSVGLSPPDAGAALKAVQILKNDQQRVPRLQENARYIFNLAKAEYFNIGTCMATAVIPVIIGDSVKTIQASLELANAGFNVKPIIYPAVAEAQARLRLFITSTHDKQQLDAVITALKKIVR